MSLSSFNSLDLVNQKRLGDHLIEAGLITPWQLEVVIYDQQSTGMRLGEILVARGWVKEEILEDLADRLTAKAKHSFHFPKHTTLLPPCAA
ncbi:MAG: hypothetical protein ACO3NK_16510 [Prochlorotrichaceae cyanobacterium]|jgi:hypothetical protein